MVRIAFINPPIRTKEPAKHVPYGIAMLGALAEDWGAEVAVEDVNATRIGLEIIRSDLQEEEKQYGKWDMIAFSGLVTTYQWQKEAIRFLRQDFPESLFIAGGGCVSALHEKMLHWIPELDVAAYGEGEKTLTQLMELASKDKLFSVEDLKTVGGLHIRDDVDQWAKVPEKANRRKRAVNKILSKRSTLYHTTPPQTLLTEKELGNLPFPAWHLFPMEPFVEQGVRIPGYFANSSLYLSAESLQAMRRVDIIGERGCTGMCRFCSHNLMGGDYLREDHCDLYGDQATSTPEGSRITPLVRFFPVEWIIDCIKYALIHFKIDFVSFMDETLLLNAKRTFEICDALEDEDLVGTFNWGCLGRVENANPILLGRIRQCGCAYISYGFESSYQPHLDYLRKQSTPEMQVKALQNTLNAGINPITSYIIGYPDESMQGLYDTCKFWIKNGIVGIKPFFLTPYPYTPVYWENKEKILSQYGYPEKRTMEEAEERFTEVCGDALDFIANLTQKFTDPELLGLREMMVNMDLEGLRRHSQWRVDHRFDDPDELIFDPDPPEEVRDENRGITL